MALFEGSILFLFLFILDVFFGYGYKEIFGDVEVHKLYLGIPVAVILFIFNNFILKNQLTPENLNAWDEKNKSFIRKVPIWVVFIFPVFLVLGVPTLYVFIKNLIV